jgi:hypothetical protein
MDLILDLKALDCAQWHAVLPIPNIWTLKLQVNGLDNILEFLKVIDIDNHVYYG